ncbi:hypothetical protein SY83_04170 [Paenibacillus swuensis]|uniref:THIF-type NAD/FAD binding fold domain-containing protein n=1 Tax=Paenibacillus swuensis TaxID=1178515 RepID=A0A172TNX8_9BACL|nr:hypothetical protein SY83_04170 [Paenibacillus swuensis]
MERDRYSRQERFAGIGAEGQRRLGEAHALIVGAGALGTGNAEALVRAGVGTVTIVDRDYVEWSNLQRQQLYAEADARERLPKAMAAAARLRAVNSAVDIRPVVADVTTAEIAALVVGVDVIVDATDNFDTRLLVNDISQQRGIPWIYGACVGSYGLTFTVIPGETPCLHCLLETVPLGGATCDTAGIISPAVTMVVAHQAAEALKLLSGARDAVRHKLVSFDLWTNQYTAIDVRKMRRSACPSCGDHPTYPHLSASEHTRTAVLCGRDTVQIRPPHPSRRSLDEVAAALSRLGDGAVERNPYLVSFTVGEHRLAIFEDGRVLVHGTKDIAAAKTLYHRYLG